MKIAMLSYWSCPGTELGVLTAGGMNVYLVELANNLARLGHTVTIFTRTHTQREDARIHFEQGVNIVHLSISDKNHYIGSTIFAKKILTYIEEKHESYDILHSHYVYSGLSGLIIKSHLSLPLFHTFHTLAIMKEKYAGIHDEKRVEAEKKIVAGADRILANTEYEKKELMEYYQGNSEKLSIIQPGVDHTVFKPHDQISARHVLRLPLHKKIILFVGRIDPVKGITTLVDAIAYLVLKYPGFEDSYKVLLIGGDIQSRTFWQNSEVKRIVSQIDMQHLSCCIKFIGSKPHSQLPLFYSASDLVVMPSVYESFGLVVLEAMASGACVVASRVGGLKYLIEDGFDGKLFSSGDAVDLANTLWDLLQNDGMRNSIKKNAVESSRELCWSNQVEKIAELYRSMISGR